MSKPELKKQIDRLTNYSTNISNQKEFFTKLNQRLPSEVEINPYIEEKEKSEHNEDTMMNVDILDETGDETGEEEMLIKYIENKEGNIRP